MSTTPAPDHGQGFVASVVIPAHNEERGIARNLAALLDGAGPLDIIVVCNGCTDTTAEVARGFEPAVRVLEITEASKSAATRLGNASSDVFPRVHLDADVALSGADLGRLLEPLARPGVLATAPQRVIPRDGCHPVVRWYYDVWEQLPQVRNGLFGRGAFALSREAQDRVSSLPTVMSDDLAASDAFRDSERLVVETATVMVWPPRTIGDLMRRRIRVVTGNAQASQVGVRRADSATGLSTLWGLARRRPALVPRIGVFLAVTVVARLRARRAARAGDFTTWQRDESSRA
ncbi:glycosyltransferase family 2 protein [Aeromicrobium sp. A1-2]|uniref:glycosyltransferase n=1 Tax=Aeromicrobium sp. A1-2 TaxID=2107713 RepID=UPI001C1F7C71|nr:glycosyltransferase [Aeromicrobium sp. A1-2]